MGYVANCPYTVKGESMSAGRLFDKLRDKSKGKVVFVIDVELCVGSLIQECRDI